MHMPSGHELMYMVIGAVLLLAFQHYKARKSV